MEFFFADPNVERMPPKEVRLLNLVAEPDSDGKRVRVAMEITPFEKRPYIELTLIDASDQEVASASIIEPMVWKLELTLHIRKAAASVPNPDSEVKKEGPAAQSEPCTLIASLSYPDVGEIDRRQITVACQQR